MGEIALVILPVIAAVAGFFIVAKINDTDDSIKKLQSRVNYQGKRITEHIDKIRDDHYEVRNQMINVQRDQNREMAKIKSEQLQLRSEMSKHQKLFNTVLRVMDKHEKYWRSKIKKD